MGLFVHINKGNAGLFHYDKSFISCSRFVNAVSQIFLHIIFLVHFFFFFLGVVAVSFPLCKKVAFGRFLFLCSLLL